MWCALEHDVLHRWQPAARNWLDLQRYSPMTVSLSPSFQLTISQNFTSSHFRNPTKTVVCSYIRAVSDTMQDTENCSWTLCRSLQAGICHVIGEVQPCFRAKVRNYVAALGFACLHVEFVCIWQPVLSIQQNLLTSVQKLLRC